MHSERLGWTFPPEKIDRPEPPAAPSLLAVGLLIESQQSAVSLTQSRNRQQVWYPVRVLSAVIGGGAVARLFNYLQAGSKPNPADMPSDEWTRHVDETENELRSIINHPDAAREAFPDENTREKIIPFLQYLRRRTGGGGET